MTRTVSLVGSTGSIGTQAVDVIEAEPDRYRVVALGAATSIDVLGAQAHRLRPDKVAIADADLAPKLEELVPAGTEVLGGTDALADIFTWRDAEELFALANFVGCTRPGYAMDPDTLSSIPSDRMRSPTSRRACRRRWSTCWSTRLSTRSCTPVSSASSSRAASPPTGGCARG